MDHKQKDAFLKLKPEEQIAALEKLQGERDEAVKSIGSAQKPKKVEGITTVHDLKPQEEPEKKSKKG